MEKIRDITIIAAAIAVIVYCLSQWGIGRYQYGPPGPVIDTKTGIIYYPEGKKLNFIDEKGKLNPRQ